MKTVSKLPFDPGLSAWTSIVDSGPDYPQLQNQITVDFAVVGAGFAGLAAARRLRQLEPNCKIALIEARAVAEGSCGRNSGFMIDLPHNLGSKDYVGKLKADRKQIKLNREAIDFARQAAVDYSMPQEAFEMSGKVNAAATQSGLKHNKNYAAHLTRLNEPFEMLDEHQMYRLSGSRYYLGGLSTPGNAMLNPGMYIRKFASGLSESGVTVFEHSPVLEFEKNGNSWLLKTPGGLVKAGNVILTVNGHIESFGYFKRRLMHIYLFGSMTRRFSSDEVKVLGGESRWGFTPADSFGTTVRRISGVGGDRILIRNGIRWAPSRTIAEARLAAMKRVHEKSFVRRFPNLSGVSMEYCWGGLLCLSRNMVPAFGELESGLYSACCQNGLGASHGTLHGKLIAELACGHSSPSLDHVLRLSEPAKLPPEPFLSIGAKTTTLWGEFKSGKEV